MTKTSHPCIVTINGGSSSIKCAVFDADDLSMRLLNAEVQRIGQSGTVLSVRDSDGKERNALPIDAADHEQAARELIDWLDKEIAVESIFAVGHRVVHGGAQLVEHQIVTDELLSELKRTQPLDL